MTDTHRIDRLKQWDDCETLTEVADWIKENSDRLDGMLILVNIEGEPRRWFMNGSSATEIIGMLEMEKARQIHATLPGFHE